MQKKSWETEKDMGEFLKSKPYERLAPIYDHVMSHVNYNLWVNYVYNITKNYLNKDSKVLELAAGNCRFAKAFSKYYPSFIATDFSSHMLLSSGETSLTRVCCEMTKLPFKYGFDLIYSTFDSVNYLTSKEKLLNLFKEVKRLLSGKGIFTFDASLERNSLIHTRESRQISYYKSVRYFQKSEYNRKNRIHKNIFHIMPDNREKYIEVHKEKIYRLETYFDLLNKAGLFVEKCLEAFSRKEGKANSKRVQFVVILKKN